MPASDVRVCLDRAAASAARIRTALDRGDSVELLPLSSDVELAGILWARLPAPDRRALHAELVNLFAELDELRRAISRSRDEAREALGTTGTFRRAVGAYARGSRG